MQAWPAEQVGSEGQLSHLDVCFLDSDFAGQGETQGLGHPAKPGRWIARLSSWFTVGCVSLGVVGLLVGTGKTRAHFMGLNSQVLCVV